VKDSDKKMKLKQHVLMLQLESMEL